MLVVITILGMLMAMVFPALQAVFSTANENVCNSKIVGLGKATQSYLSSNGGAYPGLVSRTPPYREQPNGHKQTWAVQLLPFIDQEGIHETWTMTPTELSKTGSSRMPREVSRVDAFICPSDIADSITTHPLSYVANAGSMADATRTPQINSGVGSQQSGGNTINYANGVFFNRYTGRGFDQGRAVMTEDVNRGDGAGFTILFSENVQAFNWADKRTTIQQPSPYDGDSKTATEAVQYTGFVWDGLPFNQGDGNESKEKYTYAPDLKWARPSSLHENGFHIVLADGQSHLISLDTEPWVLRRLSVSDAKKSDLPNNSPERDNTIKADLF
jgi:type II secretory pathway pseudopilin PulG